MPPLHFSSSLLRQCQGRRRLQCRRRQCRHAATKGEEKIKEGRPSPLSPFSRRGVHYCTGGYSRLTKRRTYSTVDKSERIAYVEEERVGWVDRVDRLSDERLQWKKVFSRHKYSSIVGQCLTSAGVASLYLGSYLPSTLAFYCTPRRWLFRPALMTYPYKVPFWASTACKYGCWFPTFPFTILSFPISFALP